MPPTYDVKEVIRMNEKPKNLYCLSQHFANWYLALKEDSIPDFAEPCRTCKYRVYCALHGFPWGDLILPVLAEQGINISLVHQEQQSSENSCLSGLDADNLLYSHR